MTAGNLVARKEQQSVELSENLLVVSTVDWMAAQKAYCSVGNWVASLVGGLAAPMVGWMERMSVEMRAAT